MPNVRTSLTGGVHWMKPSLTLGVITILPPLSPAHTVSSNWGAKDVAGARPFR